MKKFFMLAAAVILSASSAFSQVCEESNGLALGSVVAPCSDTPPVSTNFFNFEVWRGDLYTWNDLVANGNYVFDICQIVDPNDPNQILPTGGGLAWDVSFTVVDPNGNVIASGTDAGSVCEISFTAPVDGDYLIYLIEVGECPPVLQDPPVDNGIPRLTYDGGGSCSPPVTTCEAGTNDGLTANVLCPGDQSTLTISGTIVPNSPVQAEAYVSFAGADANASYTELIIPSVLSGIGDGGGQYTFDNALNGLLGTPDFPLLAGNFDVSLIIVTDPSGDLFDPANRCDATELEPISFLPASDPACGGTPVTVCEAGTLDVGAVEPILCPGETTDFSVTGYTLPNSPDPGVYALAFEPGPDGTGGPFFDDPNGDFSFFLTLNAPPGTENADFSIPLSATLLEATGTALAVPLDGEWNINGEIYSSDPEIPCDETPVATIDFRTSDEFPCGGPAPCENPFPAVDENSLTVAVNPNNGSIVFNWDPIPGQIGCRVRATVGDFNNPSQVGTFIKAGANANQFVAPANLLNEFTTYNFQVQCGCSQQPLVVGPYVGPISIFYISPPAITQQNGAEEATNLRLRAGAQLMAKKHSQTEIPIELWREEPMATIQPRAESSAPANANTFEVFPNPTTGVVNFDYEAEANGFVNVRVFDMLGKAVSDETVAVNEGRNFLNFDLSGNDAGIYMIEVREGQNTTIARVMLK